MSTIRYYPMGPKYSDFYYDVGVRDRIGRQDNKDISTFDLIIPTYGAWAGPSCGKGSSLPLTFEKRQLV